MPFPRPQGLVRGQAQAPPQTAASANPVKVPVGSACQLVQPGTIAMPPRCLVNGVATLRFFYAQRVRDRHSDVPTDLPEPDRCGVSWTTS